MDRQNLRCNDLIENKEDFRIIWLDANIDNSDDSVKTQTMLLELNPAAQFYTDSIQCIDVIKSIKDEQILFIISGSIAGTILPQIHRIQSIVAIFIFCAIHQYYMSLMNNYNKIIGIFVDQDKLLESLRQTLNLLEKQAMTFSLFDQKQKLSRDLSKDSASFLRHQLIFRVLEQMPSNDQSKQEFLDKCQEYYQFNKKELMKIDKFRKDYYREQAIEWYTDECFLYKLLNRALRTENIELIYSFRFIIIDLCSGIKQEQSKLKNNDIFKVYRGQAIPIEEFDKWKNNIGTVISVNGFFSTSRDIDVSLKFARNAVISNDLQPILFEIEIDPSIKTTVYAGISHKSKHYHEEEILFNLNSLFKIISVNYDSTYQIWKIELKTTDEGIGDIEEHLQYIQKEIDECSPIIYFGWLLLNELGQVDRAEKYFQMLLKTLPSDHQDIAAVYNGLGRVHSERNNLNLALENYEIAYKIRQKQLPPDHSRIAASLNNIANIIKEKGNLDKALDYFQQALMIEEKNHPGDHLQKAIIILNIGNTLIEKGDLDTALRHLSQALQMFKNILPEKHPKISTCLGDLGFVYENKGDFKTALNYYHKAFEIDEYCLPSDHPHLSTDLKKIVFTYKKNGEMIKALEFCRKKLDVLKNTSDNNHNRIAQILIAMAQVLEENNLNESLRYYNEALANLEKSMPSNQRAIAKCLNWIGRLYSMYRKFDNALENLLKALTLYHQCLSPDHIDIASICRLIGLCYQRTNKIPEALVYFNESLSIYRANYEPEHKNVKLIEADIVRLNSEQQTIINSSEPVEENINDEELITVTIDSDAPLSTVESSPQPVIDSASTSQSERNKIQNETKTPRKRKICLDCCSDCVIL